MRHSLPAVLLALLAGCASQAERPDASLAQLGLLAEEPGSGRAEQDLTGRTASPGVRSAVEHANTPITEEDIRRALAEGREARAKGLTWPIRIVGIEIAPGGSGVEARPLSASDLESLREAFPEDRRVAAVETIPSLFLPVNPDLASLRLQAARFGGDVLLLVTRGTNHYDHVNGWAFLYPTVLGLFVAPGQTLEIWTAAEAALVHVADGRPLAVVEADAREDTQLLLLADDDVPHRELLEASQRDLLAKLGQRLGEEIAELEQRADLSAR